ncbi:MAG: hypothetical protein WDO68_03450 [Gammaproteobacteria bacterium]
MNNRAVQIVAVALVGAFLAWLLMRDDEPAPTEPRAAQVPPPSTAVKPPPVDPAPAAPPPKVAFQLPKMGAAKANAESPPPPKPSGTIQIPKDWLLRGSASKNYELRSDRATAFTGNFSAVLIAHDKDVSPNLSGSGIQAALAAPYIGTRVELSAMLRGEGMRNSGTLWMYVTDPSRVIIAYQVAQMSATADPAEWTRYRVVMDIPFHGEVLAYGFTLQGKGKLWVDDVHLRAVDNTVAPTGPQNAHQVGVVAQAVSVDGALANPTNLDFEDIQITRERQPPPPTDEIKGTRF